MRVRALFATGPLIRGRSPQADRDRPAPSRVGRGAETAGLPEARLPADESGTRTLDQPRAPPSVLGEALTVGEALTPPEGLTDGDLEGVAVRDVEPGRLLGGRGVGSAFTGGGELVVAAGVRTVGDSRWDAVGRGREGRSPIVPRRPARDECVAVGSGGVGDWAAWNRDSSGIGCSGIRAARGLVCSGSSDAVATPPNRVKAAATSARPACLFSLPGRLRPALGAACGRSGGHDTSGTSWEPGS